MGAAAGGHGAINVTAPRMADFDTLGRTMTSPIAGRAPESSAAPAGPLRRPRAPTGPPAAPPAAPATPPTLTLPKGGAAVRGMGEVLEPVSMRGTAGFRVPVPVTPARGLQPDLSLVYSTGAGNSAFGLGWDLPLAAITRKTDRGLPRYADDDRFMVTGDDELVRVGLPDAGPAPFGGTGEATLRTVFRPRTEGSFQRVERHRVVATGEVFWAAYSAANVLTVFGRSAEARVADPHRPERVFTWLPEDTFDDAGSRIHYRWVADDLRGVDPRDPAEAGRDGTDLAQRYLREVAYFNVAPVADRGGYPRVDHSDAAWREAFHVLVALDYGDHTGFGGTGTPAVEPTGEWTWRPDRFSAHRAGFEVRTTRICRGFTVFHRFAALGDGWVPVAATELAHDGDPVAARLTGVTTRGYADDGSSLALPPLTLRYRPWAPGTAVDRLTDGSADGAPIGLREPYQWIDLDADGAGGILTADGGTWRYKANLGGGVFAPPRLVGPVPSHAPAARPDLAAVFGDGRLAATAHDGTTVRYSVRDPRTLDWAGWRPFPASPVVDWADPRLRQVDLDGDGVSDLLLHEGDGLSWHRFDGEAGWQRRQSASTAGDERDHPHASFTDPGSALLFADMTGDGLDDLVRVRAGSVAYWPNQGYGRFGRQVTMGGAPVLDATGEFDPARVRLVDVDGTGPADLVYLGAYAVTMYVNRAGNAWGPAQPLVAFTAPAATTAVHLVDLLGRGTQCLVLSDADAPVDGAGLRYVDLMPAGKPGLLTSVDNGRGRRIEIGYATSTEFALADRRAGRPWVTHLPIPVHVVATVTVTDDVTGLTATSSYRYRDGFYDIGEREFRGFGEVTQADTDGFGTTALPTQTAVTWAHTGSPDQSPPARDLDDVWESGARSHPAEARRALRGKPIRTATYALDGAAESRFPYAVTDHSYRVRMLDPGWGDPDGHTVTIALPAETVTTTYERTPVGAELWYPDPAYVATLPPVGPGVTEPPRRAHTIVLSVNDWGQVERSAVVSYARTDADARPAQRVTVVTTSEAAFGNRTTDAAHYRLGVALSGHGYDVVSPTAPDGDRYTLAEAMALAAAPVVADGVTGPLGAHRRKLGAVRHRYWDDAVTAELPDGGFGIRAAARRSLAAAVTEHQMAALSADLSPATFAAEGRYRHAADDDGEMLWWIASAVAQPDPVRFHRVAAVVDAYGTATFSTFDATAAVVTGTLATLARPVAATPDRFEADPAGPTWAAVTAAYDYRVLAPHTVTDPHGTVDEAAYDALGALVRRRRHGRAGEGAPAGEWDATFAYDLTSRPLRVEIMTRETYDAATVWERSVSYFDGGDRPVLTKVEAEPGPAPHYAGTALVTGVDGRPDLVDTATRWIGNGRTVYDGKARPVAAYDPYFAPDERFDDAVALASTGHPVRVRYDPAGRVTRTDFPDGTFDQVIPRPWSVESWDRADTVLASDWYSAKSASADPADQRAATASAAHAGTPSLVRLDAAGRSCETVERDGARQVTASAEFDGSGRVTSVTDPRGVVLARTSYDLIGRPMVATGPDSGEVRVAYDSLGRAMRAWSGCVGWTATTATYAVRVRSVRDGLGRDRETWVIDRDAGDTAEACRTVTAYGDDDVAFGLAHYLLGRAHQVFDGAGLAETVEVDFRGATLRSRRRFLSTVDGDQDWSAVAAAPLSRDRSGAAGGLLEPATRAAEAVVAYDALGRAVRSTYPDGSVAEPTYQRGGLIGALHVTPAGQPRRAVLDRIRYDVKRRPEISAHGPGGAVVQLSREYDPLTHRLSRLVATRTGDPGAIQDLTFGYDAVGNLLHVDDAAQATRFFRNTVVAAAKDFTYDDRYRLVSATGRELAGIAHTTADSTRRPPVRDLPDDNDLAAVVRYSEAYTYDDGGNLLALKHAQLVAGGAGWTRTLTPAAASNRLDGTSVTGAVTGSDPIAHDSRGHLTRLGYLDLTWDWRDSPRQVVVSGNVTAHYHYALDGTRIRKVVVAGARTEDRRYLGAYEVDTVTVGGAVTDGSLTLRVGAPGATVQVERATVVGGVAVDQAPTSRYQLGDQVDSTTVELDDAGRPLTYEEFHPYGTTAYESRRPGPGVSLKRYRFTAKERDDETGLNYHGARFYAPWLGRWISADPAGIVDGGNRYAYVAGRPTTANDPSGRQSVETHADDELDSGVKDPPKILPRPTPDYIDSSGEGVYLQTPDQRKAEGSNLIEGGAASPEQAMAGKVPTSGGKDVQKWVHQEAVTGAKAALRSNPVVVGGVSWVFLALMATGHKEAAAGAFDSILGPEPDSEIARTSQFYTTIALAFVETAITTGPGKGSFQLKEPSIGNVVKPPGRPKGEQLTLFDMGPPTKPTGPLTLGGSGAPPVAREIPFNIDIGEVKSTNWSANRTFGYGDRHLFVEHLDLNGGTQAALRYSPDNTVHVDLRQIGGMENPVGGSYELKLDPALIADKTAGLKFGTSAHGNAMEPLVLERVGQATGQVPVMRAPQRGGADFLPVQLNFRTQGYTWR